MTVHALTLPGEAPPSILQCCGRGCGIPIWRANKGDTRDNWHDTLSGTGMTIDEYLFAYNTVKHTSKCEFQELPPSIHIWCGRQPSQYESLEHERDLLNIARKRHP